jgi:hypothetical protein
MLVQHKHMLHYRINEVLIIHDYTSHMFIILGITSEFLNIQVGFSDLPSHIHYSCIVDHSDRPLVFPHLDYHIMFALEL